MNPETTARDRAHAAEVYREEVEPYVLDDTYDGPTTAMFSFGYGDIFADGDVVAFGSVIFNCLED